MRLAFPSGRFVDWHLHSLLIVGHDDGAQGAELSLQLLVVHGPEAVEEKVPLVPENTVNQRSKVTPEREETTTGVQMGGGHGRKRWSCFR